jgi:hypothetical protein
MRIPPNRAVAIAESPPRRMGPSSSTAARTGSPQLQACRQLEMLTGFSTSAHGRAPWWRQSSRIIRLLGSRASSSAAEQGTFNPRVLGSNPSWPSTISCVKSPPARSDPRHPRALDSPGASHGGASPIHLSRSPQGQPRRTHRMDIVRSRGPAWPAKALSRPNDDHPPGHLLLALLLRPRWACRTWPRS